MSNQQNVTNGGGWRGPQPGNRLIWAKKKSPPALRPEGTGRAIARSHLRDRVCTGNELSSSYARSAWVSLNDERVSVTEISAPLCLKHNSFIHSYMYSCISIVCYNKKIKSNTSKRKKREYRFNTDRRIIITVI